MLIKLPEDQASIKLETNLFLKKEEKKEALILLIRKILYILGNGKISSLMALGSYIYLMGHSIMELLVTVMRKARGDLFFKEVLFIKDKLDIMLHKEKEFQSMIYKNTGIWEVGSMICPMVKVSKFGETVHRIKATS